MKYLISCCAALIVAISGTNLVYAGDAEDNLGGQGPGVAVQNSLPVEAYLSGSGFVSQAEEYAAQGSGAPSGHDTSQDYLFFDAPGHEFSTEEYLFFTGSGFTS